MQHVEALRLGFSVQLRLILQTLHLHAQQFLHHAQVNIVVALVVKLAIVHQLDNAVFNRVLYGVAVHVCLARLA